MSILDSTGGVVAIPSDLEQAFIKFALASHTVRNQATPSTTEAFLAAHAELLSVIDNNLTDILSMEPVGPKVIKQINHGEAN